MKQTVLTTIKMFLETKVRGRNIHIKIKNWIHEKSKLNYQLK